VAGVKVEANIYYRDISIAGDILFTKYGISGLGHFRYELPYRRDLNRKGGVTINDRPNATNI